LGVGIKWFLVGVMVESVNEFCPKVSTLRRFDDLTMVE
jgi:hypothetical protein